MLTTRPKNFFLSVISKGVVQFVIGLVEFVVKGQTKPINLVSRF